MTLSTWFQPLADSALSAQLADSAWLFPAIESLHVLAIALVVGSIALVDLRLLGLVQRARPASAVIRELLPWTWLAFAAAVPTGLLLFAAKPVGYADSNLFRFKLLAIALAGLNMLVFHLSTQRRMADWDTGQPVMAARLAGALSLTLWLAVVLLGRWIGFEK